MIGLQRIGIETSILAPSTARYAELVRARGAALEELPPSHGLGLRAAMAVRAKLASWPADILYLDSVSSACAIVLATMAAPVKVVVRLSYLESHSRPSILARALYRLPWVELISCDIEPERAHDWLTERWLRDKITVLPSGHSTDWYEKDVDLQAFGIPGGAFTVAGASDQPDDEGLRWLVACTHWIPMDLPIHFLLIAPKSGHEQLRRLIRKMPFTQRFHLYANIEEAPGLLASSSVAVITDWSSEPQRRSCMQCLATGVPVLGVDGPLIREVVRPEVNGELLTVDDPEPLAQSIFELFEDKERRAMLSAGARRSARQWPSMHQQLLQMRSAFEQILATRSA